MSNMKNWEVVWQELRFLISYWSLKKTINRIKGIS